MRSLYALHLSLSVAIPAIQARLRLSETNRLRSAFHGGQRSVMLESDKYDKPHKSSPSEIPIRKVIDPQL
ncbi:MAG: hypothetical protein KZQ63_05490, partial [Candidatus Thiodiazotropha sp. (ex Lucinoma aequizonata)]|nr:hypothetical protein [Candidatus Thiodiazotropha sp. (ex Lucinoma aequizonata)]